MARKKYPNIEGQINLLAGDPQELDAPPVGLSVELADRAPHLIKALGAISSINSAGGLDFIHGSRKHPARPALYGRYQEGTHYVVERSQAKVPELEQAIKDETWKAGAYAKTVEAGLMTQSEAEAFHRQDLRKLREKYGGTGSAAKKRDRLKRKLQKDIRLADKSSESRAA